MTNKSRAILALVSLLLFAVLIFFVVPKSGIRYLAHYTLFFSIAILIVAVIENVKRERKYAYYLAIPIILLLQGGMNWFLVDNLGARIESSDPNLHYDFTGLNYTMIGTGLALVISIFGWVRTKSPFPWLIIVGMSVVQALIYGLYVTNFTYMR